MVTAAFIAQNENQRRLRADMGTKIKTVAQLAGVKCPKVSGDMDRLTPCDECEHHSKCLGQLGRVLGLPGS